MELIWGAAFAIATAAIVTFVRRILGFLKFGKFITRLELRKQISVRKYLIDSLPIFTGSIVFAISNLLQPDYIRIGAGIFGAIEYVVYRVLVQNDKRKFAELFERILVAGNREVWLHGEIELECKEDFAILKTKKEEYSFGLEQYEILKSTISSEKFNFNTRK